MSFPPKIECSKIIDGVVTFSPSVNYDERGCIYTSYDKNHYDKYMSEPIKFYHDKIAYSKNNVLRGLHGDSKTWKLVSCLNGKIFQVVADMRPDSPSFMKWEGWTLDENNIKEILIPPNLLNGYYVLSPFATYHYKLAYRGAYIDANDQKVVRWNDRDLNIAWPCKDPILQPRDR
jgi:dTDP-4-dehydrorhamnose 3,5-epimerase